MDKKRVGAIVGVVGVAGVIAATQFMQIDASNADYVTKNLEAQYKESLKGMDQTNASTASQTETGKTPSSDKVFDPVQKVEYRISAPQKTAEKKAEDSETSAQQSLPEADKQDVAEEKSSAKEASDRLSFLTVTPAATDQAVFPQESAKKEDSEEAHIPTEKEIAATIPKEENKQDPKFSSETSHPYVGVVVTDVLNVRQNPTLDADVVTVMLRAEVVRGTADGDWVAVEDSGNLVGYVNRHFVQAVTEEQAKAQEQANRVAAEKKAAEEQAAKKKAEEKAAADKKAEEARVAAEKKATAERVEAEKKAEAARLAAEKKEQQKAAEAKKNNAVSGYINYDSVNVRQNPNMNAPVVGTMNANDEIKGTREGDWVRFNFHGETAYVYAGLVGNTKIEISDSNTPKTAEKKRREEEAKKPKARVGYVKTPANVRKGPGTNYGILTTFGVNKYVEGQESNGWVKFDYNGQTAYISAALLANQKQEVETPAPNNTQESAPQGSAASVVEFVRSQVGKAYVFGSVGPNAYDCSSLVMAAYKRIGISLPHYSVDQYGYGYAVSMNNLQPGDLLFYTTNGTGNISHVGVYIGDGMMVHASSPSVGVIMTNIYQNWYQSRFIGARRLIN